MTAAEGPRGAPRLLLVDNYDSYTFNLYQMLALINGVEPLVIKNNAFEGDWVKAWATLSGTIDGIVISPGPGHPDVESDFGICKSLIHNAPVPVLGVCLGHQGLATAYGGEVVKAGEPMHGRISEVCHSGDEIFAHLPRTFRVVRYHSLVVKAESLPKSITPIAWTTLKDSSTQTLDEIMALRVRQKLQWGVQFHPESISSEYGFQILSNFCRLSRGESCLPCMLQHMVPKRAGSVSKSLLRPRSPERSTFEVLVSKFTNASRVGSQELFDKLFKQSSVSFWLDSSTAMSTDTASNGAFVGDRANQGKARFSYMGDFSGPLAHVLQYDLKSATTWLTNKDGTRDRFPIHILEVMRNRLQAFNGVPLAVCLENGLPCSGPTAAISALPFDFHTGYVGYLGYEALGFVADTFSHKSASEGPPGASYLFADRLVVFDHEEQSLCLLCLSETESFVENKGGEAKTRSMQQTWLLNTSLRIKQLLADSGEKSAGNGDRDKVRPSPNEGSVDIYGEVKFHTDRSRNQYEQDITDAKEEILDGETYEVCLTNQLITKTVVKDTFGFYCTLRRKNPAPYSAYLKFDLCSEQDSNDWQLQRENSSDERSQHSDWCPVPVAVCCSSPERFLRVSQDGWIESKPIKGTRPRGTDSREDARLAKDLQESLKDRAENLMIVDLVRNDLGIVCEVGSVHVPKLMTVESYETVHQLVSTVRGKLGHHKDAIDAVMAAFPGGSMTGAPKKRTMEIIRRLEKRPRGIYSGAIGFFSINGALDLNIVIRTAVCTPFGVSLGAGGAIIALSDHEDEYNEMLLKARRVLESVALFLTGKSEKYCVQTT